LPFEVCPLWGKPSWGGMSQDYQKLLTHVINFG
jgi:hypothetical protein